MDEQRAEPGLGQVGPEAIVGGRVEEGDGPPTGVGHEHLQRLAAGVPRVPDRPAQPAGDRHMRLDAHVRTG